MNLLSYFEGWVSFLKVTVYCVHSRGARLVICKLIAVAPIWLAYVLFMHVTSFSIYGRDLHISK